ncbi:putative disease resistance RPP13-like protein 3 [Acorus calamus]|uniref:Disease resistance RPP13-like protein 3 n=1 Tax=Acorus calamus TaxID=4465 RepID=A0AAV9FGE6_ACOCL|nr:putative disease resistance RPP13-like protein 3 [Acorus calamus]
MAEVAYAVAKDLARLLKDEADLLSGVREEVEYMKTQLKRMHAFLEYANVHPTENPIVKNRVGEIRDIAYEVQDVIENFFINEQRRRKRRSHCMLGFIKRHACTTLIDRHEISVNIENINKKIKEISESLPSYGIDQGSTSEVIEPRRPQPLLPPDEKDIVGLDQEVKEIMGRLRDGDGRRCTISIFGMGGLGKTTLARKVYIRAKASMQFGCLDWVTVSNEYNEQQLLLGMIKEMMGEKYAEEYSKKRLSKTDLAGELKKFLENKKYFIILDDVWNTNFWETMSCAFPDMNNGSAVMITTRYKDVAKSFDPNTPPIEMKFLSYEECLNLLVKKAGLHDASSCRVELLGPANRIVERCGRLPLGIVVFGGILSCKDRTATEWWKVAEKIKWELSKKPDDCIKVLGLSYDDLPMDLKNCFLYFSLFPEDYEIDAKKLIRLWVAEGFVQETEENTMEEVAEEYLKDLIGRCMVQMMEEDYIGGVQTCRLHDLMRELSILKAKEIRFLDTKPKPSSDARRLTISETTEEGEGQSVFQNLRTLLSFNEDSHLPYFCHRSPRVKVLHWTDCNNDSLHCIGRKYHLRYLDFCFSDWSWSPKFPRFYNLQTLKVSKGIVYVCNISRLCKLRHLILLDGEGCNTAGLEGMKDLQTLIGIKAGDWMKSDLPKLTNLRTLNISNYEGRLHEPEAFVRSLVQLKHLVTLHLSGHRIPSLRTLSGLVHLLELEISGEINGPAPRSHEELPPKLNKLVIRQCEPKHYPIAMLGKLPSLRFLQIFFYYDDGIWQMKKGDFPHLQVLKLHEVTRIQEWTVDDGALPQLQRLAISFCDQLKMLPDGLRHISTLRQLSLEITRGTPLESRVKKETGEDWDKIKHVPMIE